MLATVSADLPAVVAMVPVVEPLLTAVLASAKPAAVVPVVPVAQAVGKGV